MVSDQSIMILHWLLLNSCISNLKDFLEYKAKSKNKPIISYVIRLGHLVSFINNIVFVWLIPVLWQTLNASRCFCETGPDIKSRC